MSGRELLKGALVASKVGQGAHMLTLVVKADGFIVQEPGEQTSTGQILNVFVF